ncbi:hypothetical protein ACF1HU_35840 [Streptomyces olivaceus]|uniref:hypothetical protein n=1 Tax=Streptomyces olivaceus TaxID=47716 RepID=UPI003700B8E8
MNVILLLVAVIAWLAFKGRRRSGSGGGIPAEPPRWLPYRWVYPRVRRFAWFRVVPRWVRSTALWGLAALVVGWNTNPVLTVVVVVVTASAGGFLAHHTRDRRRHFRDLVVPLWMTVANLLDVPKGESIRQWLTVPYRLDADSAKVVLRVPRDFRGSDMQRHEITALMERRLPGEWESTWDWGRFCVTLKHPPAPPAFVSYADVVDALRKVKDGRPLVGLGTRADVVHGDFDQEAPHWALSMGTGAGKSTFLRLTIAQLARFTAYEGKPGPVERIDIMDPKRISQNCFRGVPGVYIHKTAESWVRTVQEFRAEMERRYETLDEDDKAVFPRRFLFIEEMNSFTRLIKEWWDSVREKSDPRTPPVVNDISFILNQGRQARMHVVSVFQQMNARAAGGSEARDQYGMKLLARFSPAAWNMLVGTYPRPKSSRHAGRAIVMVGDDQRIIQMPFITAKEARKFALNGRKPAETAPTSPRSSLSKDATSLPGTTLAGVPGQSPDVAGVNGRTILVTGSDGIARPALRAVPVSAPEPDPDPIVGLQAGASFLGMEREAFKKARQRDPIDGEFRSGSSPAWTEEALKEWHLNRPRAGARKLKEGAAS